jgi:tetratricopeptide (TPR) repeat protein
MTRSRGELREEAWGLSLQGYYDAALDILGSLLADDAGDIAALRLRGNVLELKAMDLFGHSYKKLTSSPDYMAARQCYERILELDPGNVRALIDLGDHFRNLEAYDRSIGYYRRAQEGLRLNRTGADWKDDIDELMKAAVLLTKVERTAKDAKEMEAWCKQAAGPGS